MINKKVALYAYGSDTLYLRHIDLDKVERFTAGELDNFLNSACEVKIASIELNYDSYETSAEEISRLVDCQMIIIKSMECYDRVYDFLQQFDLPNILYVINGVLNTPLKQATIVPSFPWIYSTAFPYLNGLNHILCDKVSAFKSKPYFFEMIYGKPRIHRNFIKERLLEFKDTDYFLESPNYGQKSNVRNPKFNFKDDLFWEDGIALSDDQSDRCTYMNVPVTTWGQVLPLKVYAQSAYSLISETSCDNRFSFITEKIAKPIIACRLFIVISGQYYLRNLRSLGFKTFDGIIDESYDDIEDNTTRWSMALDQAVKLCNMDQEEVLQKIAPIVLHNYSILAQLNTEAVNQQVELALIKNKCFKE